MAGTGKGLAIKPGYDFGLYVADRAAKFTEGWAFTVNAPYFERAGLDANDVCGLGVVDVVHDSGLISPPYAHKKWQYGGWSKRLSAL